MPRLYTRLRKARSKPIKCRQSSGLELIGGFDQARCCQGRKNPQEAKRSRNGCLHLRLSSLTARLSQTPYLIPANHLFSGSALYQNSIMQRDKAGPLLINAIADTFKDFWSCYSPTRTLPVLTKFLSDSQRVVREYASKHHPQRPISSNAHLHHGGMMTAPIGPTNLCELDDMIDDKFAAEENDAFLARYTHNHQEAQLLSTSDQLLDTHRDPQPEPDIDFLDTCEGGSDSCILRPTKDNIIDGLFGDHSPVARGINNGGEAPESEGPPYLPTTPPNPLERQVPDNGDRDRAVPRIVRRKDVGTSMVPERIASRPVQPNFVQDSRHKINTANSSASCETVNNTLDVGTDDEDTDPTNYIAGGYSCSLVVPPTTRPRGREHDSRTALSTEVAGPDGKVDPPTSKGAPQRRRKRKSQNDSVYRQPTPRKRQIISHMGTRAQTEKGKPDLFESITGKIVAPDLIRSILSQRIDALYHQHLPFLLRLFFYSWGPYALRQIADGCATMRGTVTTENSHRYPGVPDLSKALDRLEFGVPIRRRSYLVQLLEDRQQRESSYLQVKAANRHGPRVSKAQTGQHILKSPGRKLKRCDSKALADMMSEQHPAVASSDLDYGPRLKVLQNRLSNAVNWQIAQRRHQSALWMYPCGVEYLSTSE